MQTTPHMNKSLTLWSFSTLQKNAIQIIHGKRHHHCTRIDTCPPKYFPCLPILKCWRQTNGGTSSTRQFFSTISNKRQRHAYLRRTSKNVSNARSTRNKSPNKHNSNTQRAPTSLQHHLGRPRQSTSRIGPRNSTFRISFISATQNFNAALHSTQIRTISKGGARIHRQTITPYPRVE